MYRIAIASTDGIVVNQHFGRADRFHIVEITPETGKYNFLESRAVLPFCHGGEHDDNAFDTILETLNDVQAILVSKIGDGASDYLEQKGIIVYQAPFPIVALLEKIIQEKLWEKGNWQSYNNN